MIDLSSYAFLILPVTEAVDGGFVSVTVATSLLHKLASLTLIVAARVDAHSR